MIESQKHTTAIWLMSQKVQYSPTITRLLQMVITNVLPIRQPEQKESSLISTAYAI